MKRRDLLLGAGAVGMMAAGAPRAEADAGKALDLTSHIYESLGVRPFINAKGTFTILTGSQTLPEVKQAMREASQHYVHMDELMEAVGRRIAEITKAEWGIVTDGCAAAITHTTAACIAGADPEKMQRLPNLTGLKDQVVMPRYSRNQYDHAARMLGVQVVEVETEQELLAALGPRAAMVLILSCPDAQKPPLNIETICRHARSRNVPVLVDAAAERMTIPNIHLAKGANMVAYSGGKCLRGPQAGGLLLGQKDILQAAWLNSAPHHAFGRSLKVGKEEIMGMLTALEMWVRRDHDAEWKRWESWLDIIRTKACSVAGVSYEILQPEDLSNNAPQLHLKWDAAQVGITGDEVRQALDQGNPRIWLAGARGRRPKQMQSSVYIMPYMMQPGDAEVVAQKLYEALTHPPKVEEPKAPSGPTAELAGLWECKIEFLRGTATHYLSFEQSGSELKGAHQMQFLKNPLHGEVQGSEFSFHSAHRYEGTVLGYAFRGRQEGDVLKGEVQLDEYGKANWTARRA